MLEPNELYVIADRMVEIYEELNKWAVVDMADRIMEMQELGLDNLPGTVQGLAWIASQSGMHYQDMLKQIEDLTDISTEELHRLFEKSAVKSVINDNEMYKRFGKNIGISSWDNMSDSNKQIVEAMYERTDKQLRNFTRSTARASQQQLHNALDTAYNEIIFGYKSYDKAIADAIEKVAKKGTVVTYDSGYQDSIETSIRRAVMTGINQTAGQISIKNALDVGAEFVKISSHSNARVSEDKIANHKGWQGKVYKLEGKTKKYGNLFEETGFDYEGKKSNPLGLCGYNCRHVINAYFPEYEETYEGDDEVAISQEEKEHKQLALEREFARERRTLERTIDALESAIDNCNDEKIKAELINRKRDTINEYNKLLAKKAQMNIIKNIELPAEVSNISGITPDTVQEISKAFDVLKEEYDIKLDKISVESLGKDNINVPFQFVPVNVGGFYEGKIVINKDYYFNDSLEAFEARIMRNHDKKVLAAKNVEDLIAHEIAHILTFQHCDTFGEYVRVQEEVFDKFIKGMSMYADSKFDGAETIAEAFIRYRRGEELPDDVMELLKEYIERWKK